MDSKPAALRGIGRRDCSRNGSIERDAVALCLGREERVDAVELRSHRSIVDIVLSFVAPIAVDGIDVDPERVIPIRAAARREKFAERHEQQVEKRIATRIF